MPVKYPQRIHIRITHDAKKILGDIRLLEFSISRKSDVCYSYINIPETGIKQFKMLMLVAGLNCTKGITLYDYLVSAPADSLT